MGKESACQCRRHWFDPWVMKIPWKRKWQPTPVFLPGKSYGQKSLVGYSPWGWKIVGQDLAAKQQQLLCKVVFSSVAQSCLTLCDPMDCCPPGSSVPGIFQARILECVAISFSRGSSWPRDRIWVSCTAGRFFTDWASREAHESYLSWFMKPPPRSG